MSAQTTTEKELIKIRKLLQLLVDLQYRRHDGAEHDEKRKDVKL